MIIHYLQLTKSGPNLSVFSQTFDLCKLRVSGGSEGPEPSESACSTACRDCQGRGRGRVDHDGSLGDVAPLSEGLFPPNSVATLSGSYGEC